MNSSQPGSQAPQSHALGSQSRNSQSRRPRLRRLLAPDSPPWLRTLTKSTLRPFTRTFALVRPYFHFAYSVHWFFISTLLGIVLSIVIFATDTQAILLKRSQMPLAELYDFDIYQASDEAVLFHIRGEKALRFSEYEKTYETILRRVAPGQNVGKKRQKLESPVIEYIYGPEIVRRNDIYHFDKGGVYAKNSGEVFYSKQARYDAVNGVFTGVGRFWASSIMGSMEGENLIYRQAQQTSNAQNITATIQLEERKRTSKNQAKESKQ